jgi:uncharacterized protein
VIYLLDANMLIALLDPLHLFHDAAHRWWAQNEPRQWASCPLTENAFVRICSHPRYGNRPGNASVVAGLLRQFISLGNHRFWPDQLSLLDAAHFDLEQISHPGELTDVYLLALAASNNAHLATLDHKLRPHAARAGAEWLHLISSI